MALVGAVLIQSRAWEVSNFVSVRGSIILQSSSSGEQEEVFTLNIQYKAPAIIENFSNGVKILSTIFLSSMGGFIPHEGLQEGIKWPAGCFEYQMVPFI